VFAFSGILISCCDENSHRDRRAGSLATVVRKLNIFGEVQGVGFRYHFSERAQGLGIAGWVRNRRDGSVEAMVEGTPDAVEALLAWARLGPPAARVERVEVSAAEGAFAGFELRPTQ
jgi:acylphosphatase